MTEIIISMIYQRFWLTLLGERLRPSTYHVKKKAKQKNKQTVDCVLKSHHLLGKMLTNATSF